MFNSYERKKRFDLQAGDSTYIINARVIFTCLCRLSSYNKAKTISVLTNVFTEK